MFFKVEKNDYSNFNLMIFVNNMISLLVLLGLLIIDDDLIALRGNKKIFDFNKKQNKNDNIEVDIYNENTSLKDINSV